MSAKTRINRPTTATPKNPVQPRMLHQSTNLAREDGKLRAIAPPVTYKRPTAEEEREGMRQNNRMDRMTHPTPQSK